jgi:hypothetical protein
LLSIAVSWGEVLGARKIFIGAVAEDSSGYPDCRPEFYDAFNRVIAVGTKPDTQLEIVTPVIHLRKSEIVRRGVELGALIKMLHDTKARTLQSFLHSDFFARQYAGREGDLREGEGFGAFPSVANRPPGGRQSAQGNQSDQDILPLSLSTVSVFLPFLCYERSHQVKH